MTCNPKNCSALQIYTYYFSPFLDLPSLPLQVSWRWRWMCSSVLRSPPVSETCSGSQISGQTALSQACSPPAWKHVQAFLSKTSFLFVSSFTFIEGSLFTSELVNWLLQCPPVRHFMGFCALQQNNAWLQEVFSLQTRKNICTCALCYNADTHNCMYRAGVRASNQYAIIMWRLVVYQHWELP